MHLAIQTSIAISPIKFKKEDQGMLPKVVIFRLYKSSQIQFVQTRLLEKSDYSSLPYLVHKMQNGTALQKYRSTKWSNRITNAILINYSNVILMRLSTIEILPKAVFLETFVCQMLFHGNSMPLYPLTAHIIIPYKFLTIMFFPEQSTKEKSGTSLFLLHIQAQVNKVDVCYTKKGEIIINPY